jgi:hypothetical protein
MSDGALNELYDDADEAATPAEAPAPVVDTPAAAPSEPSAAPAQPAEAQLQQQPAAPATTEQQSHSVPLSVLLRTREEFGGKLTAVEQRALDAERQLAEYRRREEAAGQDIPHPLDDPDGFKASLLKLQQRAVHEAVGPLRQQHQQQLEQLSKTMMVRHLGSEKFGELQKFIDAAPDQAHAAALKTADPYGWFYERYEEAQKRRKEQDALKQLDQLGGKSIDEIVAERVAAALAEREAAAGQPQAQPQAQPAAPTQARNPDGTFASPSGQQPHRPASLANVNGAAIPATTPPGSALDELYPN